MFSDPAIRAATWGFLGAFIYAAPKWLACIMASRAAGVGSWLCTLEAVVALIVGAIAAAAFGGLALTTFHVKDENAICAVIGLLANRKEIVEGISTAVGNVVSGKLLKALKGDAE